MDNDEYLNCAENLFMFSVTMQWTTKIKNYNKAVFSPRYDSVMVMTNVTIKITDGT